MDNFVLVPGVHRHMPQLGAAVHLPPGEDRRAQSPRVGRQESHHHDRVGAASGELVSPVGSSRFLFSRCAAVDEIQEVPTAPAAPQAAAPGGDVRREEPAAPADVKSTNSTQEQMDRDQVVVLEVSLHCKACAGKVKKHLAKMEEFAMEWSLPEVSSDAV
ncbi:heavy metal-associated domain containing protein [Hordeum vulgare]|nr:heavy metal-associated domain containing protein [Hordeum vulgare]